LALLGREKNNQHKTNDMRKIYLLLFTALALFIAVNADAQTKPTNKKITGSVDSSLLKTKNILSIIDPGGDGGSGGTGGTGGTTAASTTTAVANANTTFGSTAVNLIATVTATPDGGTVTFLLKDYPSVGTNTSIGTATKGLDTRYTLVYNPSALQANTYTVMANFGGTTAFASSTSDISPTSANGTLTVSQCSVFDRAFSQDAFICGGGGTQFVYLGTSGPGAVIRWYSDAQGTNLIGEGTTLGVSAPANYPGTIDRYDTYVPNGTITYYGRYEDPAPCLNATLQAVSVTVVYPSFATGARAMNDQLCSGNSTQLILEGLGAQSSVIKWYTDAGGTNLVGEGNGMYVSPTQTTTYYGRYEDSRPCIHYTAMRSVTVYVYTSSVATGATASNSSICSGGITQLILQGTAGSGAVVQWFSDAGGTNLIGEGNNFSVSPTVATTYYGRFDDHSICQTQTPLLPVTINIITDNQYPTLSATPMVTGNADAGVCSKMLNLTAPTASDNCGIAAAGVTASGIPPANNYPVGTTTVTWSVTDVNGNTTTQTQSVVITDNQYPTLSATPMVSGNAWPPNHKMKAVPVIINSTDNCPGAGATCKVISITSNEPISNLGNGDTEIDYEILGDQLVNLRAERSASGEGRVYTITVQCDDGHGNIATKSTIVRVAHNIKAPAAGSSVKIGTTINMTGTFWDITGNKHTAKWLVDGASIKGTLTEPAGTKNGTVSGSYKLATAGVYRLQMNVTDQKGVTSYATTNGYDEAIVVAYDPNGGYTYGGKKYISPKGALPSNPNVAGEMTYGFETNYYKGAVNPKGETWFALNNGEFEFNALNFDYLVVSGAKAQFKGLGKMVLNGIEQSGIAFILTVIDGQLNGGGGIDKIRMKIYNKNSGEVYYDNQPGASDADAPVTVVENNIAGDGIVVVNTSTSSSAITQALKVGIENAADVPASFGAMAYPNPSPKHFTIQIKTDNKKDVIRMIVYDWSGRTIERNSNVPIGQLIRLGSSYTPGVYIVEIIQGKNRVELKLIKQPD
jgi:hypothetical protein